MRFAFDSDQLAFQSVVREVLEKECRPDDVRAAVSDGWSRARWKRLAELGVVGLTAPAAAGGLGMDCLDLALVLEECGRACLPEPVTETTAVCLPVLAGALEDERISAMASGEVLAAVGLGAAPVAGAASADLLLLRSGGELHLLEAAAARITVQRSLDGSRKLASVDWVPARDSLVLAGEAGRVAIEEAFNRGALAAACELLGVAQHLVDSAVAHARQRVQFGQPIGSFQAVKHLLADALVALEFARPVVYHAAYSMARDSDRCVRDVSMAKAYASRAVWLACRTALQVHGAIGYTWEHDLQLWLKRGWSLALAWGDSGFHRSRIAGEVLRGN